LDTCTGAPEFQVTPPSTELVCLLSQGWFEDPVRTWPTEAANLPHSPHIKKNRQVKLKTQPTLVPPTYPGISSPDLQI